jgi:hypothetical protein
MASYFIPSTGWSLKEIINSLVGRRNAMKSKKLLFLVLGLVMVVCATESQAGVPMPLPDANTPTLKGGQVLDPGSVAIGATTGYPETAFNVYFGITPVFDLGITVGLTYGDGNWGSTNWNNANWNNRGNTISGLRQGVGLDLNVPLRFTLFHAGIVAGGLKVTPYFMIGDGSPSVSFGADAAFMIDIAVPKIFKVIVGPELRTGIASMGDKDWAGGRWTIYDGGLWLNAGLETVLAKKWMLGLMFQGGGSWSAGDFSDGNGIFRFLLYFAYKL